MARSAWILPAVVLVVWLSACSSERPAPRSESPPREQPPPPVVTPPPPSPPAAAEPPSEGVRRKTSAKPPSASESASAPTGPADTAIPEFPWPPPAASARQVIRRDLLAASRRLDRLGDVDALLSDALEHAGYTEKSYWSVPLGFALATRLEQIDAAGKPKPPPARWSAKMPRLTGGFSLRAYLRALFTAQPGYYRIVVFIVTSALFSDSNQPVTSDEARAWAAKGLNALPESLASQPYGPDVVCTAMIYEFERQSGSEATPLVPSPLDAHAHLVGSGLWAALGGR